MGFRVEGSACFWGVLDSGVGLNTGSHKLDRQRRVFQSFFREFQKQGNPAKGPQIILFGFCINLRESDSNPKLFGLRLKSLVLSLP